MKKLPAYLKMVTACSIMLALTACSKSSNDEKSCGERVTWFSLDYTAADFRTNYVEGDVRYFIFEDISTPEDICPKEHIKCSWFVVLKKTAPNMAIGGKVYWMGVYEEQVDLAVTDVVCTAEKSVGLAQAFNDNEAWVGMQLLIAFHTQGSYEQDVQYLADLLSSVKMRIDYNLYKS